MRGFRVKNILKINEEKVAKSVLRLYLYPIKQKHKSK
jgi:hypothetical protein